LKIIAILHIIVSNIRKWHISMFGRMVTCTRTSTIQVQVQVLHHYLVPVSRANLQADHEFACDWISTAAHHVSLLLG